MANVEIGRQGRADEDIISQCQKDIASWYAYFSDNIDNYRDNISFYSGNQWDKATAVSYASQHKPTLVIDLIGQNIRKMKGEQRNADVSPQAIGASVETSQHILDLTNGMIRKWLYDNESRDQFSVAYQSELAGGWGALQVYTDYENDHTFNQKAMLYADTDPIYVFFDPLAKSKYKTDGRFSGNYEIISREEFEKKYPDKQWVKASFLPDNAPYFALPGEDAGVIVRYYLREYETKTLIELSNGVNFKKECYSDEIEEVEAEYYALMETQGVPLLYVPPLEEVNRRQTDVSNIMCYVLTKQEVLEKYEWKSKRLPHIFVDGDSFYNDGRQWTRSFLESAKDAQRLYNYAMSEVAFGLKTSRREKLLMTPKQAAGLEEDLRNPEKVQGVLLYNPDPDAPPPQALTGQEVSQSFFMAAQNAAQDVNKTLGMLDPVGGDLPAGSSGIAINRTLNQQNLTVVNFVSNLYGAMEEAAKIYLDLVPHIYDSERVISIRDEDNKTQRVAINKANEYGEIENDMSQISEEIAGIEIVAGASFAAQKQMALQFLMQLYQDPNTAPFIADLIPRELELSIAPLLEERLKYRVPPYVLEGQPAPPPQPNPEIELKQKELQLKQMTIESDAAKHAQQVQLDKLKMQLQAAEAQIDLVKEEMRGATEIKAAQINTHGEVVKSIADVQKNLHQIHHERTQPRAASSGVDVNTRGNRERRKSHVSSSKR
jgi:hypothetical protein